jgi:hypothetical protein
MVKRKPDGKGVIVHRIELQTKERELLEQYMYMQQGNKLIQSITQLKLPELYGILNLLELFGLIDTPIPTVADASEIPSAIRSWVETTRINPETGERETVLLQDRILNFLGQLVDPEAWGITAFMTPEEKVRAKYGEDVYDRQQANNDDPSRPDFIGPQYKPD